MTNQALTSIEIDLNTPNGPVVEYGPEDDAAAVEAELPVGWRVDWETPAYKLTSGRYRAPLVKLVAAKDRLTELLAIGGNPEVIETDTHQYEGHTILIATVVGDPDSDGDEYYSDDVYLAWDEGLDRTGERGACTVSAQELSTWLSLRWPCTIGGAGFARDGEWYEDGRAAVR